MGYFVSGLDGEAETTIERRSRAIGPSRRLGSGAEGPGFAKRPKKHVTLW